MKEREPNKEVVERGELLYLTQPLTHPETEQSFSGYGLVTESDRKENLVGLLMVDRPQMADPSWLEAVQDVYGECHLVTMTSAGERGIACNMQIESDSAPYLRRFPSDKSGAIQKALEPLLDNPPKPSFSLYWDEESRLWRSKFAFPNELPPEISEIFENTGYGCLAAETNIGIVHVCHANDFDIEGFANKPVVSRWQLIRMSTAPLIRLELAILDKPEDPYRFESFLNVAADNQAKVLDELANQNELHMAFYGDGLQYRYTKSIPHTGQQWQQLDEMVAIANKYWGQLPPEQRDFDRAKVDFIRQSS